MQKADFIAEIRAGIAHNRRWVEAEFLPLEPAVLAWKPDAREWSVLECIEHLHLTHRYYRARIEPALAEARPAPAEAPLDRYRPSTLGRIYMFFAFNPNMRFPAPGKVVPERRIDPRTLQDYLDDLAALHGLVERAEQADLTRTRVSLERGTRFNLGDCLKVLVGHDALHLDQAHRVLEAREMDAGEDRAG